MNYIIKPVCQECGFDVPDRVDLIPNPNSITDRIIKCLSTYDLVIVDLTEHNPNVFYELGYRNALQKPVIQLKLKLDNIPFDVSNINTIDYVLNDLDEVQKAKERLTSMIKTFDFSSSNEVESNIFQQNISSTILQEIYKIKDDLSQIKEQTKLYDTNAVSVLADKLTASTQKTDNQILMETILPTLIENPEKFMNFVNMANQLNSHNKSK